MGLLGIVEMEVGIEAGLGLPSVRVGFQVHLLVFHRPPQPLHKDVIMDNPDVAVRELPARIAPSQTQNQQEIERLRREMDEMKKELEETRDVEKDREMDCVLNDGWWINGKCEK